jgi:REP element-mobilizing transposase RayT
VLPERTYLITRRCIERRLLLQPDEFTRSTFLYCLAEAAAKHEIDILGWMVMSNHHHVVVHDPGGSLPAFMARLHRQVALVMNARLKRRENFWSSDKPSAVHLVQSVDVFEKVVYTLANPVASNLVARAADWTGASSLAHMGGPALVLRRPGLFFRAAGRLPESVELRIWTPPDWPGGERAWTAAIRARVRGLEDRARRLRRSSPSKGARLRSRKPPDARPRTTPRGTGLRPEFACRDPQRRAEIVRERKSFLMSYLIARCRLRDGELGVVFPAGTYKLHVELGVPRANHPDRLGAAKVEAAASDHLWT